MLTEYINQLKLCELIARDSHTGQFRRDGVTPYILHPLSVARRLAGAKKTAIVQCVALLHDVLEDTFTTQTELLRSGVDKRVVDSVVLLTKVDSLTYEEYLKSIKGNEIARLVKIYDMIDNLADNPSDSQLKRYSKGLAFLTGV